METALAPRGELLHRQRSLLIANGVFKKELFIFNLGDRGSTFSDLLENSKMQMNFLIQRNLLCEFLSYPM
jgi:hypothetical protein